MKPFVAIDPLKFLGAYKEVSDRMKDAEQKHQLFLKEWAWKSSDRNSKQCLVFETRHTKNNPQAGIPIWKAWGDRTNLERVGTKGNQPGKVNIPKAPSLLLSFKNPKSCKLNKRIFQS